MAASAFTYFKSLLGFGGYNTFEPPSTPHRSNGLFLVKYAVGKRIGNGSSGIVYEAINKLTGLKFAVKVVQRINESESSCARNEVSMLQHLQHPNIIKCIDFYEESHAYYIVLELMEGGDLFDKICKRTCYTEKQARDTFVVLLTTVKYCHDRNVMHRCMLFIDSCIHHRIMRISCFQRP